MNIARPIYCFAITFIAIWASLSNAGASTYYVAKSGNDFNRGTLTSPFRTIQKAADVVRPGDMVIVKKGVYTADNGNFVVNLNRGGNSKEWITFRSDVKWGAVLDGRNNRTSFCWNFGSNANYVRVEDFEVRGCGMAGFFSNAKSHDVYLYGNNIHDIGRRCSNNAYGQAGAFQGPGTSYYTYDNNVIHDIGRFPCGNPQDFNHDHGLYIEGNHITIKKNFFYNNKAGWSILLDGNFFDIKENMFAGSNPKRFGDIVITADPRGHHPAHLKIDNNISFGAERCFIYSYQEKGSLTWSFTNNLIYPASNKLVLSDNQTVIYAH